MLVSRRGMYITGILFSRQTGGPITEWALITGVLTVLMLLFLGLLRVTIALYLWKKLICF